MKATPQNGKGLVDEGDCPAADGFDPIRAFDFVTCRDDEVLSLVSEEYPGMAVFDDLAQMLERQRRR